VIHVMDFIEQMKEQLKEDRAAHLETLGRGLAADYNAYNRTVGAADALQRIISYLDEQQTKLVKADE